MSYYSGMGFLKRTININIQRTDIIIIRMVRAGF